MDDTAARTVTFVFSDIEGSTRLLRALGDAYAGLLLEQRGILAGAAERHGGRVIGQEGDALFMAFEEAGGALAAAVVAQRTIDGHAWPAGHPVRVRMGVHTGEVVPLGEDYVGLALHETARITAAGHGGQVLVSPATRELAIDRLPPGTSLRDLGEHRLKDLPRPLRLFQLEVPGLPVGFPPLRTLEAVGAHLPSQVTSFVGRAEVDRAAGLLERSRLLTLTGPGGTGKTRLSLQLAAEAAPRFPDGTYFVALEAITDPALVPSEIAAALGIPAAADPPLARVIEHLRERSVLLVLDNLEQVVAAAADIGRIVSECPRVSVLATSRIPLRLYGEQELPVPPLPVPAEGTPLTAEEAARSEAVRLFVERAMAARPDFALSEANAAAVADIVRRLDGLPLAIELAAARLRSLPLEAVRARLDGRLALLTGGARDASDRQRTLRGAIDWSHDLLDAPDRALFARFAVFAGGADLPQVEQACGPAQDLGREVLDGLVSLSEQSLVRGMDQAGDEPRFGMLATIREYALERMAEAEDGARVHERHAQAYLDLAESCSALLTGPDGRHWNDRLEADHDNLRAALDWTVAADRADMGMRLVAAIWRFWQVRGHLHEAERRIHEVLALPSAAAQPSALRARAEGAAGSIAYWRGKVDSTHRHYQAALAQARASGDSAVLAGALYDAGFAPEPSIASAEGRYRAGRPLFEESLALARELGDRAGTAKALWALAIADMTDRDTASATDRIRESAALARELGDPFLMGWASHMVGLLATIGGRFEEAHDSLGEALRIFEQAGDQGGVTLMLVDFGILAVNEGSAERGWRLLGAGDALRERTGLDLAVQEFEQIGWERGRHPSTEAERRAFEEGRGLTAAEAIAEALGRPPS